jgi:adenylyltransferase/sulfurtransferase
MLERYSRQVLFEGIGEQGQRRLLESQAVVIGCGALGAMHAETLARAGVGRLRLVDRDVVELSNLHRQLIFREDQVGQPKAETAAAFARSLNSNVEVEAVACRLDDGNARELLAGHNLVLDGSDNFVTRLAVNQACVELAVPLVSAAAAQFQAQVALLRGWEAGQPCYRCFVGDAFDSDDCDTCAELGVLGALTGTAGHFAALVALRALIGIGNDAAGKLFLLDGAVLNWREMKLPKDPRCKTCGRLE